MVLLDGSPCSVKTIRMVGIRTQDTTSDLTTTYRGNYYVTRNTTVTGGGSRVRRVTAVALGGTLLAVGLRRRSLGGTVLALAGGWLLYRGVGGSEGRGTENRGAEEGEVSPERSSGRTTVERSVTVGESADDLARYWRDPELLTQIVGNFAEVTATGEDRHHWTMNSPFGRSIGWETEIVEDRPGERLRWQSSESAMLSNEWTVDFRPAPADRGTEVTLEVRFDPPGGSVGHTAMELLGVVPATLAEKALDRFKSLAETGEIPTLERNSSARGSGDRL